MEEDLRLPEHLERSPQSGYVTYSDFELEPAWSPTQEDVKVAFKEYKTQVEASDSNAVHHHYEKTSPPSKKAAIKSPSTHKSAQEIWHPQAMKMKKLWQRTKEELEATKVDLASTKERYFRLGAEQRHLKAKEEEAGNLGLANRSLYDQLQRAEHHVDILRQEKTKLNHENSHLMTRLDSCMAELSIMEQKEADYEKRLKDSKQKTIDLAQKEQDLKTQALVMERENSVVISRKDEFVRQQQQKIDELMRENTRLKTFNESVSVHNRESEKLLKEKLQHCTKLEKSLDVVTEDLLAERNRSLNERQLQMELAHLRLDNKRMISLISGTKEFQAFKFYAETGAMSFLPPSEELKAAEIEYGLSGLVSTKDKEALMQWGKSVTEISREYDMPISSVSPSSASYAQEEEKWIPREALLLAHKFKAKHLLTLPIEIIHEFLRQLNIVWQRRERWRANKVKEDVKDRMTMLERKVKSKIPVQQVLQDREISRLKREILKLYKERQRKAVSAATLKTQEDLSVPWSSSFDGGEFDSSFIEKSMATAEDLSRQLLESSARNQELEAMVRHYEGEFKSRKKKGKKKNKTPPANGVAGETCADFNFGQAYPIPDFRDLASQVESRKSTIFMEGVSWLGDRMVQVAEEFSTQWVELLIEARRKSHALPSDKPVIRGKELMKLLLQLDGSLRKVLNVYQSKIRTTYEDAMECLRMESRA